MLDNPLLTLILSFIGAGGGAYFGAYLKKKGENLATHEDIGKLIEQVAAVTKATKEIGSQISDQVWNRQRRWEITKEALTELTATLSQTMEALTLLDSTFRGSVELSSAGNAAWAARKSEALDAWTLASSVLSRALLLAELVCGSEVKTVMYAFNLLIRKIAGDVLAGNGETFRSSLVQWTAHQNLLLRAIRSELGFAEVSTPRSSGSSAVRAPAAPAP